MDQIVRSTVPLIYDARDQKSAFIALKISDWTREEKFNRFKAVVEDFIVTDVVDPQPGQPLKSYTPINRKDVVYTNQEIDNLFNFIAIPIEVGDSYSDKQQSLLANALLIVTQQKPIFGSNAGQWEIVDRALEIAPGEPEPPIEE